MDKALAESDLPQRKKKEFVTAKRILGKMTPEAVRLFHANVKSVQFYPSHDALTQGFRAKYSRAKVKGLLKGCFDRDGELHLNGGGELFGRPAPLSEFYAHEMTHALDCNHSLSGTPEWKTAWEKERAFLNASGQRDVVEGLAELGQMVLGSKITRAELRQVMPRCLRFWEGRKL